MGQNSMKEHLLTSATKCDSWTNFVREIESIEHARKTITAPTPMDLDAFQGNCHKCGKYGHTAKECRSSNHGGAEKPQCAQCGKTSWTVLGTELHIIPQRFTEWRMEKRQKRKRRGNPERWKVQRWEKAETMRKERTTSQRNHRTTRKNSGRVDLGNSGLNNLGAQKPTLRVGVAMIGTLQIRILRRVCL